MCMLFRLCAVIQHGIAVWLLALCIGGHAASADEAADPINPQCKGHIGEFIKSKTYVEKGFNHKRQKGWYYRWWSGRCDKVPYPDRWTCTTSKGAVREGAADQDKAWRKMVERFAAEDGNKAEIAKAMCKLGELIGLEWARDNDVRCIHTSDLKGLWVALENQDKGTRLQRIADVRDEALEIIQRCRQSKRKLIEARRRKQR